MLEISLEFRKGFLFVRLIGSLNRNTTSKLEEEVTSLIQKNGITNVVFNMDELNELDLKGVHGLFHSYEVCTKNNGVTLICGLQNSSVKERIKKSRLLQYFKETNDELEAFAYE